MTFSDYQILARETAIYPNLGNNYIYPTLGLCGETGEVAEKIKKVIRDKKGVIGDIDKVELAKELGDVLWYVANLATELNFDLNVVARMNVDKLLDRKERERLHGGGDNR